MWGIGDVGEPVIGESAVVRVLVLGHTIMSVAMLDPLMDELLLL